MFRAGDLVELDLESDVNLDYDGTLNEEEMEWLASRGVVPNTVYEIIKVMVEPDDDYTYAMIAPDKHCFMGERFKLAAPLTLENE